MGIALDYQLHRTSVDIAKGYRQLEKAATALSKGKVDIVSLHLTHALSDFGTAVDHAAKAEDDACIAAGKAIDKGNDQLQKSIDAYADGNVDSAQSHYDKAADSYDKALDLIG